MEIGITSFVETKPDVHSGEIISHHSVYVK